jgi:hypothetical protein
VLFAFFKRHDDWTVIPNLYGAMIGRPSLLKSPAMKRAVEIPLSGCDRSKAGINAEAMNERSRHACCRSE